MSQERMGPGGGTGLFSSIDLLSISQYLVFPSGANVLKSILAD